MEGKNLNFDVIDYKILCILKDNPRESAKEIATLLNLDIRTVNKRITALESSGAMRTSIVLNPNNFAYPCIEEIYIKIDEENYNETINLLKADARISYMAVHWGANSVELQGRFHTHSEMHNFLHAELPAIKGVKVISSTQAPDIQKDIDSWFPCEYMFEKV